jgi:hypothetical protein
MSKIDRLRVAAGQDGGGWEIRTPEGLPPTRFPSVRPRPLGESSAASLPTDSAALAQDARGGNAAHPGGQPRWLNWREAPRMAFIPPTPPGPEGSKGTRALTGVRGVPFAW